MDLLHNTKQILLVDDEAIIAANLAAILGRYGYEMRIAVSGEEGVRIAEGDAGIDLVLMDLSLGKGIDGVEAARRILEKRLLPIVFLSNYMDPSIVQKTAAVDSYGYVVKDSAESVLVTTIGMALRLHEAHRAIRNKNDEIAAANEELQSAIEELEETNDELLERERELMAEREFNRTLVESSPAFIVAISPEGAMLMMNESMRTALGYGSADEVVGADYLATFVPEEDRADLAAVFADLIQHGRQAIHENRVLAKDGRLILVEWHGRPIYRNDRLEYVIGIGIDITEKKRNEVALAESHANLQRSQEIGRIGDWRLELATMRFTASAVALRMFGFPAGSEPSFEEMAALIAPDDRLRAREAMQTAQAFGMPYEIEIRVTRKDDGREIVVISRAEVERDANGRPWALFGINQDITDMRRVEGALRTSEDRHRGLLRSMMDGFVLTDLNGNILEFNDAYRAMLGYEQGELLNMRYQDITPARWHAMERGIIQEQLFSNGFTGIYEKEYVCKDGSVVSVELRTALIRDVDGEPVDMWAIVRDVSERKRTEQERERAWALLDASIEHSPSGIIIAEAPDARITIVNPAAFRIRGGCRDSLIGIDYSMHSMYWQTFRADGSEYPTEELPLSRAILRGEITSDEEVIIVDADGMRHWVSVNAAPVLDHDGSIIAGVVVFHDVTEKKSLHDALLESEEKYRTIFEKSTDGIMLMDSDHFIDCNEAALRIAGLPEKSMLIGRCPWDVSPNMQPDGSLSTVKAAKMIAEAYANGSSHFEWVHCHSSGSELFIDVVLIVVTMQGRQLLHVTWRDVTHRKYAEMALRESEERLRTFIETITQGIAIVDESGLLVEWNHAAEMISGIPASEALGRFWWDVAIRSVPKERRTEERRRELEAVVRRGLETGVPIFTGPIVVPIEAADGTIKYTEQQVLPTKTAHGNQFVCIMSDITERIRAVKALRESEERFRALAENSRDTIMRFDREHRHLYVNPAAEAETGIAPGVFIGKTHRELGFPSDLCDLWGKAIGNVFATGEANRVEFSLPKGQYIDWLLVPEFDRNGEVYAVMTAARDITERKRIEVALKESEDKYRVLFESAPVVIFQTTPPGEIKLILKQAYSG
ncbi:MAG TPA: PAS domain S-box protein [Spirochaetota bacterium]|nr:PAS domain S-box protein [Spirochaetota bacterium]